MNSSGRAASMSFVLGREAVEERQPLEIAGVELVVQGVAQVVLDDGLGEARLRRLLAHEARELAAAGVVGGAQEPLDLRSGRGFPHGPEREDEGMAGEGPPLGGEIEHDVAVLAGLERRIADDEARVGGSPPPSAYDGRRP